MAMCKECKIVVGAEEIENGICKVCREKGIVGEVREESPAEQSVTRSDFGNPLSFKGRSGRLDYLVYGVLLSYSLIFGGVVLGSQTGNTVLLIAMIMLGAWIALASTVRRARDREESIFVIILLSLIPYVGFIVTLYLLLAPKKWTAVQPVAAEEKSETVPLTVSVEKGEVK